MAQKITENDTLRDIIYKTKERHDALMNTHIQRTLANQSKLTKKHIENIYKICQIQNYQLLWSFPV